MHRALAAGLLTIVLSIGSIGLASCSLGGSSGFVTRSNHTCADATKTIEALKSPRDPHAALAYALDRYVQVEHAVSTLTDSSLPGGAVGRDLRDRWLRPARASLRTADTSLNRLRDAVRDGDRNGVSSAFAAAAEAGTSGVDTALLRERALSACATLFTPSAPTLA
jgi:hypothetical protein